MATQKAVKAFYAAIDASDQATVDRLLSAEPELSHAEYKKILPVTLAVKNGNAEIGAGFSKPCFK